MGLLVQRKMGLTRLAPGLLHVQSGKVNFLPRVLALSSAEHLTESQDLCGPTYTINLFRTLQCLITDT